MPLLHLLTLFSREKWMPFGHRWPGLGKSARNTKSEIHCLAQVPDRQPNKRCNWRCGTAHAIMEPVVPLNRRYFSQRLARKRRGTIDLLLEQRSQVSAQTHETY